MQPFCLRILGISFLGFFLFSCAEEKKEEKEIRVSTYIVEPQTLDLHFEFVGVCQSSHLVEIRSRVEGYLKEVSYTEGAFVKEGQPLFKIDAREYESHVAETKAILEKEKAILWSAEKAVERYKPLYEQKAASRRDWEDASSQLLAQQAVVDFNKAKLSEAELNLSYTEISSPIDGFTTNSRFQEGSLISPGVNDLLTTVSVLDPIWVIVNVSDSYFVESAQEIAEGKLIVPKEYGFDVKLVLSDGSQYPYSGKVSFVSPVLNPNTGTLSARGIFPNPDFILKPGQFVRAEISGAKRPNAIIVPQSAVLQGENGRFVYVVVGGDRVERRDVVTGSWYEDYWIIKSGLKKGDEVIREGVNKVKEGTVVKVINRPKKNRTNSQ